MTLFNQLTLRQKLGITLALPILCSLYLLCGELLKSQQFQRDLVNNQPLHHRAQQLSQQLPSNTAAEAQAQAEIAILASALQQSIGELRQTSNVGLLSSISVTVTACLLSIFLFLYLLKAIELNLRSMARSTQKLAQVLGLNITLNDRAGDELKHLNQYLINITRQVHTAVIDSDERKEKNSSDQELLANTLLAAAKASDQSIAQEQLLLTVKAKMESLRDELTYANHSIKELDDNSKAKVILDIMQRVMDQSDLMALNIHVETSGEKSVQFSEKSDANTVEPSQKTHTNNGNVITLKLNEKKQTVEDKDKS